MFISYSQNFEDVILHRALKEVEKGFYIDVGACDPVTDSVTKAFYDRGWRGINIEPSRSNYDRLVADRPRDINLMVAAGSRRTQVVFYEVKGGGWSTANKAIANQLASQGHEMQEYEVPCLPLADICAENLAGEVHFLKIDVEGMEAEVLEGFDFSTCRPWIILIEAVHPITHEPVVPWEPMLLQQDYEFVYYDGLNRFYLACERSHLKEALTIPPNVFDSFIRYSDWRREQETQQLQSQLAQVATELEATRPKEAALDAQLEILGAELTELRAQLADVSRELDATHAEEAALRVQQETMAALLTELRAERDAAARRADEAEATIQAVSASVSWRITAPLRFGKALLVRTRRAIGGVFKGLVRFPFRLAMRALAGLARWAARDPWLFSLGERLTRRTPTLRARIARLISQEPYGVAAESRQPHRFSGKETDLSESARAILEELKQAMNQEASRRGR